jgi:hypothetical protein
MGTQDMGTYNQSCRQNNFLGPAAGGFDGIKLLDQ